MTTPRPYYFLGQSRALTTLSTGEPFFVDTASRDIATWIILGGIWETFVDDVLCALVSTGDVVLDVGANMGYYSVKLGCRVGVSGKLFSFEPNPRLYKILFDNIQINGLAARAKLFRAAAGRATARSKLIFDPSYSGGGTVVESAYPTPRGLEAVEIDVVSVDEALGGEVVADLIKIDIEGGEPAALAGAEKLLARSPQASIVAEFNYAQWARFGDPFQLLVSSMPNRRIFHISTDGKLDELFPASAAGTLRADLLCYLLLLPADSRRYSRIARFVRNPRSR